MKTDRIVSITIALGTVVILLLPAPARGMEDVATGRWMTRDPREYAPELELPPTPMIPPMSAPQQAQGAEDGTIANYHAECLHLFQFCQGRPTILTDPSGFSPTPGEATCCRDFIKTAPPAAEAGTACCCGQPITCWMPGIVYPYPGFRLCVGVHEGHHVSNCDCTVNPSDPITGVAPCYSKAGGPMNECEAYALEVACLRGQMLVDCHFPAVNVECIKAYLCRIWKACDVGNHFCAIAGGPPQNCGPRPPGCR